MHLMCSIRISFIYQCHIEVDAALNIFFVVYIHHKNVVRRGEEYSRNNTPSSSGIKLFLASHIS